MIFFCFLHNVRNFASQGDRETSTWIRRRMHLFRRNQMKLGVSRSSPHFLSSSFSFLKLHSLALICRGLAEQIEDPPIQQARYSSSCWLYTVASSCQLGKNVSWEMGSGTTTVPCASLTFPVWNKNRTRSTFTPRVSRTAESSVPRLHPSVGDLSQLHLTDVRCSNTQNRRKDPHLHVGHYGFATCLCHGGGTYHCSIRDFSFHHLFYLCWSATTSHCRWFDRVRYHQYHQYHQDPYSFLETVVWTSTVHWKWSLVG